MEIKAKSKRIADLKAFLEAESARLEREIAQCETALDEDHAGYGNHMADSATTVFEQAMSVGHRRDQELMLADVADALKRIAGGTYGACRHCGEPIDSARLRALPTATRCYGCQSHRDQQ